LRTTAFIEVSKTDICHTSPWKHLAEPPGSVAHSLGTTGIRYFKEVTKARCLEGKKRCPELGCKNIFESGQTRKFL